MGKKGQARRRQRARASFRQELSWWGAKPVGSARGGTPEAVQMAEEFSSDNEVACRATFLSDPMFGSVATTASDGETLPVLLLEAKRMMGLQDTRTGSIREARTEALISGGFQRIDGPVWRLIPADGWGVYRDRAKVLLRDPDGEVSAKGTYHLDPAWVSAAVSLGWVLVLHGYPLGVTLPPEKTEKSYTAGDRAREITQARRSGLLAGALVEWRGSPAETLDWTLFPAGAFGLPLPLAHIPLFELNRGGGPAEFGFTSLSQPVMLPVAEGMAAIVTDTDLDLVRPDVAGPGRLIAGYHDGKDSANHDFFQSWRQAVLTAGGLVVMAGSRRMPGVLGTSKEQDRLAMEAMHDSWGAKVILDETCCPGPLNATASGPAGSPTREVITLAEQQSEYVQVLEKKLAGLESFEVYIADAIAAVIPVEPVRAWLTNLWPVACQTCGEPLGTKADLSADGPIEGEKILLSLHHSSCRPSGVTPPGGVSMCCPTTSFAAGYLARPDWKPRESDVPVMVINPSCEQLQLSRTASGAWRNATVGAFSALGFTRPDGQLPPAVRDVEAEIDGGYLIVTVTGYIPHAPDHEFALMPPRHVLDQVRRMNGIAVSIATSVVPSLLRPEDLPGAFLDEESLVGWVPLAG